MPETAPSTTTGLETIVRPFVELHSGFHWKVTSDDLEALRDFYNSADHPDFHLADPFTAPYEVAIPQRPEHRLAKVRGQVSALPFSLALRMHDSLAPYDRSIRDSEVDETIQAFHNHVSTGVMGPHLRTDAQHEAFAIEEQQKAVTAAFMISAARNTSLNGVRDAFTYMNDRNLFAKRQRRFIRSVLEATL